MYSSPEYRQYQYFVAPEWTGGIYASPSIAGSRAGAMIAGTWAAMVHIGQQGYVDAAQRILSAAQRITEGVRGMKNLRLYGEPDLSVVCFGAVDASQLNIYNVGDELSSRGWNLNILQVRCLCLCCIHELTRSEPCLHSHLRDLCQRWAS